MTIWHFLKRTKKCFKMNIQFRPVTGIRDSLQLIGEFDWRNSKILFHREVCSQPYQPTFIYCLINQRSWNAWISIFITINMILPTSKSSTASYAMLRQFQIEFEILDDIWYQLYSTWVMESSVTYVPDASALYRHAASSQDVYTCTESEVSCRVAQKLWHQRSGL